MKKQARVLVIGGGAIGVSVAYHLAKYGWKDVVLVEKHELTSGSTWMAAGNCSFYHSNYYCTQVNMKSIELYQKLEAETGQSTGWHTTGSIRTADNPDRMDELGYYYSMNRCLGLNVRRVTPSEIAQLHPLMNVEGLMGGLYWPDDGDVDPSSITLAMSIGAKKLGAEINTRTRVTGIRRTPSNEWVVHTDKGDVTCEYVVNAAGLWAPEVARMVGLEIPSIAIEHTHILFEAIDAVKNRKTPLPLVRDPDRSIYIRQEMDSLLLGMYEKKGKQWYPKGVPWDYAQAELTPDIDNIAENIEHGIFRMPILGETGFKHVTAGPITYTPNGDPLVGPAYPLKNFFHACGYSFGITQAGGIGHYIAGWIMEGEPEIDLWSVDSRRYGSYATWAYNREKIADTYPRLYSIFFPNEFRDAARPNRVSPIYEYQKQAGAVFGDYFGWECPNYFTRTEADRYEKPSWRRSNAFNHVAEECHHVMNHVGLLDLTRFAKTRISGPDAEAWLGKLTCQRVPAQTGRVALAPMLSKKGVFKTDMTVTKLGENDYLCVTASLGKRHDQHWLMQNLPADGSVQMQDLTYAMGCLDHRRPQEPRSAGGRDRRRRLQRGVSLRHQPGALRGPYPMPGQPHELRGRAGIRDLPPHCAAGLRLPGAGGGRVEVQPENVRHARHGFHAPGKGLSRLEERDEPASYPARNPPGLDRQVGQGLHREIRPGKAKEGRHQTKAGLPGGGGGCIRPVGLQPDLPR